jgi:hypothetical protein
MILVLVGYYRNANDEASSTKKKEAEMKQHRRKRRRHAVGCTGYYIMEMEMLERVLYDG